MKSYMIKLYIYMILNKLRIKTSKIERRLFVYGNKKAIRKKNN